MIKCMICHIMKIILNILSNVFISIRCSSGQSTREDGTIYPCSQVTADSEKTGRYIHAHMSRQTQRRRDDISMLTCHGRLREDGTIYPCSHVTADSEKTVMAIYPCSHVTAD